jgi:hypothetical protein
MGVSISGYTPVLGLEIQPLDLMHWRKPPPAGPLAMDHVPEVPAVALILANPKQVEWSFYQVLLKLQNKAVRTIEIHRIGVKI